MANKTSPWQFLNGKQNVPMAVHILANASKTAVARAIVASTSLGILSAALGIAGVIFGEASRIHTGMTVKIQYHYIYSNNMIVEWVVGPMQHSFW